MKNFFLLLICLLVESTFSQEQAISMKNITSSYHYKTHYVSIDSTEIAYVKEGNHKETLLFIP